MHHKLLIRQAKERVNS